MKPISSLGPYVVGAGAAVALLTGCSAGGQLMPPTPMLGNAVQSATEARSGLDGYVYVSNRTKSGASELLVYRKGTENPSPIRTIKKDLVDPGGIAVDSAGDVYVANGSAGNVLEFAPGGTSLIETYSQGLYRPVNVTVAGGILYVADQAGQYVEYATGDGTPLFPIAGLGANVGVAVDPAGSPGTFFGSDTSLTTIPPTGGCPGTSSVGEDLFPTLWVAIPLPRNKQALGLAFDSDGNLYASDFCANDVVIYSDVDYTWTYSGKVSGIFKGPMFLTIDNQFLAIPSAASTRAGTPGYVTMIDLTKQLPTVTITDGLQHPIGAAVAL